jgi:Tol biopolymer transport system component
MLIAGQANVSGAQPSPDGRWILFTSDESARGELYVQAFPIGGPRYMVSTGGTLGGVWTRGGSEIWYAGVDQKAHTVSVAIKNGTPVFGLPVERGDLTSVGTGDTAPSGRALVAIPATEDDPTPLTLLTNWTAVLK